MTVRPDHLLVGSLLDGKSTEYWAVLFSNGRIYPRRQSIRLTQRMVNESQSQA